MPDQVKIGVICSAPHRLADAKQLAAHYAWPLLETMTADFDCCLIYSPSFVGLQYAIESPPFYIDFLSPQLSWRLQHAGLRKEKLARAIGKTPREQPLIIDATAGLGRDSFMLAGLGFSVTMLEQSPILHAMLADAIERARGQLPEIMARLTLIHADAIDWLPGKSADVIYLDPMFPARKKSASVKKDMVILQHLLPKSDNVDELLETALACARYRVVIKRPRLADPVSIKPHYSLTGSSSRFDVYLCERP